MFVDDISLESMIHAIILRSPSKKCKLVEIKSPRLPTPYVLITAKDIPGKNELDDFGIPILASEFISYIGEPVGLIAGPDLLKLENFASQCIIEVQEALLPEPPDQSEEIQAFCKLDYNSGGPDDSQNPDESVMPELITSGTYNTGIQEHWYSEPHCAVAQFVEKKMTIYTASQWPHNIKRSVSKMLKIYDSAIEIIPTELGLHLDGKLVYPSFISCQAALAAHITKKPVKIKLTRTADFRWSPKRSSSEIHLASALGKKGEIINTEIHTSIDMGSQNFFAKEMLSHTCLGSLGIYKLGKINLKGYALKTEKPPQGPMEGLGISQGFFASECHISRIADSLRQDPAEWRKKNCITKNDSLAIGIPLKENVPVPLLIDTVASMSDYYRKWASNELLRQDRNNKWNTTGHETNRGIGIATAFQGSGFLYSGKDKGVYGIELTLGKDSSLQVKTSILLSGEETFSIWRKIAKDILGVDENLITIINTGTVPDSGPSGISRNISVITRLMERCCETIRKQRFRDPLPITVRKSIKPEKFTPWKSNNKIENKSENNSESADSLVYNKPAWGAAVTEIELDDITHQPKIRGIWLAVEGGKIYSQKQAKRVLRLAIINAIGWCTTEKISYNNGVIPTNLIMNYNLSQPLDIPPIYIDFLPNDSAGSKGIGELPYSCVPASYIQAVSQAIDFPFEKIPINTEDIWEVRKNKDTEIA